MSANHNVGFNNTRIGTDPFTSPFIPNKAYQSPPKKPLKSSSSNKLGRLLLTGTQFVGNIIAIGRVFFLEALGTFILLRRLTRNAPKYMLARMSILMMNTVLYVFPKFKHLQSRQDSKLSQYYTERMNNFMNFKLNEYTKRPHTLITYAFNHANYLHMFLNMLALVDLGRLEQSIGSAVFLVCYLTICITSILCPLAFTGFFSPHQQILGASGGVYGMLMMDLLSNITHQSSYIRTALSFIAEIVFTDFIISFALPIARSVHLFGLLSGLVLDGGLKWLSSNPLFSTLRSLSSASTVAALSFMRNQQPIPKAITSSAPSGYQSRPTLPRV